MAYAQLRSDLSGELQEKKTAGRKNPVEQRSQRYALLCSSLRLDFSSQKPQMNLERYDGIVVGTRIARPNIPFFVAGPVYLKTTNKRHQTTTSKRQQPKQCHRHTSGHNQCFRAHERTQIFLVSPKCPSSFLLCRRGILYTLLHSPPYSYVEAYRGRKAPGSIKMKHVCRNAKNNELPLVYVRFIEH